MAFKKKLQKIKFYDLYNNYIGSFDASDAAIIDDIELETKEINMDVKKYYSIDNLKNNKEVMLWHLKENH